MTVLVCLAESFCRISLIRKRNSTSCVVWPVWLRNVLYPAAVGNWEFLAVVNAFWTSASVTLMPILAASAWYQ